VGLYGLGACRGGAIRELCHGDRDEHDQQHAVEDDNPDHYFGAEPEIQIVKLTNGTDNDTPTGPIVPVGSTVTWTYNVTNPGNEPIANVVVTDDNGTPLDLLDDFNPAPTLVGGFNVGDLNTDNLLDPGELWVYTASALAVAGQYENYATVTGTSTISETPLEDDNPDHYFGGVPTFVLGPDKNPGVPQEVKVVDITGEVLASFPAYGNTYVGGTRVAIADLDGDGTDEIITAPGRNHAPEIKVFTLEGGEVPGFPSFLAYDEDFAGRCPVDGRVRQRRRISGHYHRSKLWDWGSSSLL
jgi:hypothetical protein